MNKLKNTRCYLGGSMELSSDRFGWRTILQEKLEKLNIKVLDPTGIMFDGQIAETDDHFETLKFYRESGNLPKVHEIMAEIVQRDLRAIDISDFVIFNIDFTIPTFGTIHELIIALQQQKPVFVIGNKKKIGLWLLGLMKPSYFYETVDDVMYVLEAINDGRCYCDSKKWKLLDESLR